jgi:hypothetical protein
MNLVQVHHGTFNGNHHWSPKYRPLLQRVGHLILILRTMHKKLMIGRQVGSVHVFILCRIHGTPLRFRVTSPSAADC